MNETMKTIFNIPNILTLSRMALLPVIILLMYAGLGWAALVLYAIAAITDFLDGYIARKFNMVSSFGTFLDPISDKVFVALMLIVLVDTGQLSGLFILPVLVILTREFLVSGLREFLGPKDVQVPVTQLAKWKTTVQMVALGLLIVGHESFALLVLGLVLICAAAGITAYTGYLYLQASWTHLTDDSA